MQPLARNLVGIITSVLWLGVGAYTVVRGVDETWRMAGFVMVGVGVFRAALLVRQWNRGRSSED